MTKVKVKTNAATASPPKVKPAAPEVYCTIGLVIGTTSASSATAAATCLVTYPENPSNEAQSALVLSHVPTVLPGQSVLLQFIQADLSRPVVLGVLGVYSAALPDAPAPTVEVQLQDQTLTLLAQKRLVLRCGKASIVLQEDGSIEIRGTDLTSRASGQNAVRGASITLN